jgi:Uma2 family endonuclease
MTVGDKHRIVVTRLVQLAPQFLPFNCFLQSQQPIAIPPINEPEPDIAIVRGNIDDYREGPPSPKDVISVIEVSDSSLNRDLDAKLHQYAAARISEYIVVDLVSSVVLIHQHPDNGVYPSPQTLRAGEMLRISTAGSNVVSIAAEKLLA